MTVDVLISSVSKAPDLLTKMIVVGQNFSYRIEVLASVSALIRGKKKRDALQRLLARTRELQAERNFVVHAIWFDSVPSHYGYLLKKNAKGVREET